MRKDPTTLKRNRFSLTFMTLLAGAILPVAAADIPGFTHWTASQLKSYSRTLAPKINAQKVASEQLAKFGNHSSMIAHREGNGEAELHEIQADLFVVQSGTATLIVGGEIVGAKTTAPNEVRGPSIKGGEQKKLAAGDIVHIPAKIPHQLLVETGKEFTYFVMKIESPGGTR